MARPPTYFVIFGAAILPDGSPSGTLRRRIAGAFAAGGASPSTFYLPTGGVGRHGPSEARVMRDELIAFGVSPEQIIEEETATDTLSSAVACAEILSARGVDEPVGVCSSGYHQLRCAALLRLRGVKTFSPPMPSDREALGLRRWLYYVAREVIGTPWDTTLLVWERLRGR
ncbi:MAG: YdcF family protein [Myxococcota bacterium]